MLALLDAFFQIAIRRSGPEDLPESVFLLQVVLAAYLVTQLPVAVILYGWGGTALLAIVLDSVLLGLAFWLLLRLTGRSARFQRTFTALLGTGALLALPQAPLVYLSKAASVAGQTPVGPSFGLLALLVWSILVQAHIASRALSSGFATGLAVALSYFMLSYQIAGQLLPMQD